MNLAAGNKLVLQIDNMKRQLGVLRGLVEADSTAITALQAENEALRLQVTTLNDRDTTRLRQIELLVAGEQEAISKIEAANAGRVKAEKQRDRAKRWGKFWRVVAFIAGIGAAVGWLH